MSFVWAEYLKIAEDILAYKQRSACHEAAVRTAISRAYYAAYQVARAEIVTKRKVELPDIPGGVHARLVQALYTRVDPAWKTAGRELDNLRLARVSTDYEPLLPKNWGKDAATLERTATDFIKRARQLMTDIPTLPILPQP